MKRVGYWISEKKSQKLKFDDVVRLCSEHNVEVVKIDIDRSIESQGPFDLVLHKFTDHMGMAEAGNPEAIVQLENLKNFFKQHPELPVLDPLDNVYLLLNRHRQYNVVKECPLINKEGGKFLIPPFIEFPTVDFTDNRKRMLCAGVNFPIVCKPILAHGPPICHQMSIVFNDEGLHDIQMPCIAQSFLPHGAVLFKVFVLGNQVSIISRPSLKNFQAGDYETIHFHSHDVSKPTSASKLSELDEEDKKKKIPEINVEEVRPLAMEISRAFGLSVVGIDVIVSQIDGKFAVIDVNAFPGYEGTPDLPNKFYNLFLQAIEEGPKKIVKTQNSTHNIEDICSKNRTSDSSTNEYSNGSDEDHIKDRLSVIQKIKEVNNFNAIPVKKAKLETDLVVVNMDGKTALTKKQGPRSLSPDH